MGWVNDARKGLAEGRAVQVRPVGGSMRERIESGLLLIGNNLGKVNGWVAASAVVGRVVAVGE